MKIQPRYNEDIAKMLQRYKKELKDKFILLNILEINKKDVALGYVRGSSRTSNSHTPLG